METGRAKNSSMRMRKHIEFLEVYLNAQKSDVKNTVSINKKRVRISKSPGWRFFKLLYHKLDYDYEKEFDIIKWIIYKKETKNKKMKTIIQCTPTK